MKIFKYDTLVIGGGASGMAAAVATAEEGWNVAVVEREDCLGGILNQCIHNGFGLHYFKEELTGPAYAEKFSRMVESSGITVYLEMTIMDIERDGAQLTVYGMSRNMGMAEFRVRSVVFANGCRERNRGNIGIPGTRPAGVFTAGLAQRLVNLEGLIPGKECVIVGSGDIGLIMARRMSWIGSKVKAVVEIQPNPAGLTRNIVQCLKDFDIPLYLSHVVGKIRGKDRVEAVDIVPLENGIERGEKAFTVKCDTILLAVGLVPDNELARKIGIRINQETGGPVVDSTLMTSIDGVFACGNLLHVHDLVDYVTEESIRCGKFVSRYLNGDKPEVQYGTRPGKNVKYLVPDSYEPGRENVFYLRTLIVKNKAQLSVKINGVEILRKKLRHIQPSEMISFVLKKEHFDDINNPGSLEVSLI